MAHCWHRGKDDKGRRVWYCCMCQKAPSEVKKEDRPKKAPSEVKKEDRPKELERTPGVAAVSRRGEGVS